MTQDIYKVSIKVWGGGASSCEPYSSLNVKIFKESSQPLANVCVPKNQATSKMVELATFSFISLPVFSIPIHCLHGQESFVWVKLWDWPHAVFLIPAEDCFPVSPTCRAAFHFIFCIGERVLFFVVFWLERDSD